MRISTSQTTQASHLRIGAGKPLFFCLLTFFLVALGSLGVYLPARNDPGDQPDAAKQKPDQGAAKRPVILLTGFEPYGRRRLPNPSWEGIKDLDGQQWKGYQLVCKQAQVIWGAPLEQLQAWISEYQPVAVFSFGQGGRGSFALESEATNARADTKDNRGDRPPDAKIVADGPEHFEASINCEKLSRALADKGYRIHVSTDAGSYLCEEALYSLEYLKSTRHLETNVLFCHVPPLGNKVRGKPVTPEYVQQFVKDLLDSWHALYQDRSASGTGKDRNDPKPADPRTQEIKEFIGRYFTTWSEQDMKGYDSCFAPDASIQFLSSQGRLYTFSRPQFVADQREYHRKSAERTTEVPESIDVRIEAKMARAVVYWKLTAGTRTEKGYDHFTLAKQDGKWQIVNLVFYTTEGDEP